MCVRIGLRISDLDLLEYGMVMDMIIENGNNDHEYKQLATQADFDRF